ncbi:hypothetical protein SmJEL517_g00204 [Synchytrium microbalum]|uniref:Bromo domain-containing protein n=1 Tax=Synchytrium microbalum TaxID=1806994 RepID=A0A507CG70_9FUNG|nr:uncharacterized protein SmJEL517_g00204 [Synchytrium microbalum]TPX38189.1 hypothetical protein SmJEL517_g00204 [Synchytrium microbalum]
MAESHPQKRPAEQDLDAHDDSETKSKRYRLDEQPTETLDNGESHYDNGHIEDHTDYNHDNNGVEPDIRSISDDPHGYQQNFDSPAGSVDDQNGYDADVADDYTGGGSAHDLNDDGLLASPAMPTTSHPIDFNATPLNAPIPVLPGHSVSHIREVQVPGHIVATSADPATNAEQLKYAVTMIKTLRRNKDCMAFLEPVDPVKHGIPTYFSVVTYPMDTSTILRKLEAHQYPNIMAVIDDCNAMLMNCYRFNGPEHIVSKQGQNLAKTLAKYLEKTPLQPKPSASKNRKKSGSFSMSGQGGGSRGGSREPDRNYDPTRPKRDIHPPARVVTEAMPGKKGKRASAQLKFSGAVIKELFKEEYKSFTYPFLQPVDPTALGIPHYRTIIKHPMDLGTIRKRFEAGHYTDPAEIEHDVRLVVGNAKKFNQPGEPVHEMARRLEQLFEARWKELPNFVGAAAAMGGGGESEDEEDDDDDDSSEDAISAIEAPAPSAVAPNSQIELLQQNLQLMTAQLNLLVQSQQQPKKKKRDKKEKKEKKEKRKSLSSGLPSMPFPVPNSMPMPQHQSKQPKPQNKPPKATRPPSFSGPPTSNALPTPVNRAKPPAPKKQKVKKEDAKELTYEQKLELSNRFTQGLSEEVMGQVFSIIREGMPGIDANAHEELELDIDNLDPVTLRRLYNYVVKGRLSKSKAKPPTAKHGGSDSSSSDGDSDSDDGPSSGTSSGSNASGSSPARRGVAQVSTATRTSGGGDGAPSSAPVATTHKEAAMVRGRKWDDPDDIGDALADASEPSPSKTPRSAQRSNKRRIDSSSPEPEAVKTVPSAPQPQSAKPSTVPPTSIATTPKTQPALVKSRSTTPSAAPTRPSSEEVRPTSATASSGNNAASGTNKSKPVGQSPSVSAPRVATPNAQPIRTGTPLISSKVSVSPALSPASGVKPSAVPSSMPVAASTGNVPLVKRPILPTTAMKRGPSGTGSGSGDQSAIQKALAVSEAASKLMEYEKQQQRKEADERLAKRREREQNDEIIRKAQVEERERRRLAEVDFELKKMRGQTAIQPPPSRVPKEDLELTVDRMQKLLPAEATELYKNDKKARDLIWKQRAPLLDVIPIQGDIINSVPRDEDESDEHRIAAASRSRIREAIVNDLLSGHTTKCADDAAHPEFADESLLNAADLEDGEIA